jgi:hypothetical protein
VDLESSDSQPSDVAAARPRQSLTISAALFAIRVALDWRRAHSWIQWSFPGSPFVATRGCRLISALDRSPVSHLSRPSSPSTGSGPRRIWPLHDILERAPWGSGLPGPLRFRSQAFSTSQRFASRFEVTALLHAVAALRALLRDSFSSWRLGLPKQPAPTPNLTHVREIALSP